ncbi:MAG: M4 family metallopeptidase [Myxococcota bacterium]
MTGFGTALAACGDDDKKGNQADTAADVADVADGADAAPDSTDPTIANDDVVESDVPLANVYHVSPAVTPETEVVELAHLTSSDGTLSGEYANVRNCVPDDSAASQEFDLGGFTLNVIPCTPKYTAFPDATGTYLAIEPPATPADDDGTFAEVQMYHHMQVVHDYFKTVHGLTNRDAPLDSLVNVQAHIDLCDEWAKLPNAAFIPHEGLAQLPVDLGLTGDAIVFSGTDTKNFAFDASVIYHEYTHSILGNTRLGGVFVDDQGINNLPGALNEGYADYFAATLVGESNIGKYSLDDLGDFAICGFPLGGGGNQSRDLATSFSCPDDLTAEVHADSSIFSSALWQIRDELGATDADKVILAGVLTLTDTSDFTVAAEATVDAAKDILGEEAAGKVKAAFDQRHIIGCSRVLPIAKVGARGLAVTLEPKDAFQPNPFPGYTAGYLQYGLDIPAGAKEVVVTLEFQAGAFGGGTAPNLEAAIKRGGEAVKYHVGFGAGSVTHDADQVLPVTAKKIRIAGPCLTEGPLVIALHNKGDSQSLVGITAKTATETSGDDTYTDCPAP